MTSLRVLIIADDPLARAGLAMLLTGVGDFPVEIEIVMQLSSEDPSLDDAINRYALDVVLWDVGWEAPDDLGRLSDIGETGLSIVALLPTADSARAIWTSGIRGLVERDASGERIVAALLAAANDLVVVDPAMATVLPLARAANETELVVDSLTVRELDVLQLLAEGAANKEIARRLAISENTVKYHVNAILSKLGAQSRTEAVVRATRAGLILL